jgi:hypothetical protein
MSYIDVKIIKREGFSWKVSRSLIDVRGSRLIGSSMSLAAKVYLEENVPW